MTGKDDRNITESESFDDIGNSLEQDSNDIGDIIELIQGMRNDIQTIADTSRQIKRTLEMNLALISFTVPALTVIMFIAARSLGWL